MTTTDRPHDWRIVRITRPGGYTYRCQSCGETWTGDDLFKRPDGPCGRGL